MLDEVDALIINYIISGKPKEVAMSVTNIDEQTYEYRIEKLRNLGIDFEGLREEKKELSAKGKYVKLKIEPIDLKIVDVLQEEKSVTDVSKILDIDLKSVVATVKKFANLGIQFEGVVQEQRAIEFEKEQLRKKREQEKAEKERIRSEKAQEREEKYRKKKEEIHEKAEMRAREAKKKAYLAEVMREQKREKREQMRKQKNEQKAKEKEEAKLGKLLQAKKEAEVEAERIYEMSKQIDLKTIQELDLRKTDSITRDAAILYLLQQKKEGTDKNNSQNEVSRILKYSKQFISNRVQRMKALGISIPKRKSNNNRKITKPSKNDICVFNMLVGGYTEKETMSALKMSPERFSKSVLRLRKAGYKFKVHKSKKPTISLDDIDRIILRAKTVNPGISLKDIAKAANRSPSSISKRITRLRDYHYLRPISRKTSIKGVRRAVNSLIESDGMPKSAINTIANYYDVNPKQVRNLARFLTDTYSGDKDKGKERE